MSVHFFLHFAAYLSKLEDDNRSYQQKTRKTQVNYQQIAFRELPLSHGHTRSERRKNPSLLTAQPSHTSSLSVTQKW